MRVMLKLAALGAAAALTSCGPPAGDFHDTFNQAATEACERTAGAKGVDPAKVGPYCACFVGEFRDLTVAQKMSLDADRARVDAAAKACGARVFGAVPA